MNAALSDKTAIHIASLVSIASREDKLSGVADLLRTIAEALSAHSCILWQVTSESNLGGGGEHLFVLAQWSKDEHEGFSYNLPVSSSVTGKAIQSRKSIGLENVRDDPRAMNSDPFLTASEVKAMCVIPIVFLDQTKGAVNLYKTSGEGFRRDEIAQAELLVSTVPALYQGIRERISFNLLQRIHSDLREAELQVDEAGFPSEEITRVLQTVCAQVGASFQSFETSIFLEDPLELTGLYKLVATTWPASVSKTTYEASSTDGLTGWVLARGKSVRIFDLAHFERDKKRIMREYRGISWHDSLGIASSVRTFLGLRPEEHLPPLSFMAVPIKEGSRVLGVIRCSAAKTGSYYFSDRELRMLELVAAQISHYWSNWRRRYQVEEENRAWRALVSSVGELSRLAYDELTQEAPNEAHIFSEALKVVGSLIEEAEIMDVRLFDERTGELYYAQTYGEQWKLNAEEIQRRFGVDPPKSAGALVFKSGKLYEIPDVNLDPYYSESVDPTKRMIVAPIKIEDKVFGVLDIRGIGKRRFPRHALAVAEMMGQQLGLYCYLAQTIRRIHQAETELRKQVGTQIQTFEDLQHQLRSPIIQAYARVDSLLKEPVDEKTLQRHLLAVRGLAGKAKRVTTNTRLFASLARGESFVPKLSRLRLDNLVKMLVEAASDNTFMFDPARGITVNVDRKRFEVLDSRSVKVDVDLLEQAVYNILDNAYKYSFDETVIRIYGGLTASGRFHITFANKGIQIHPSDTANVAKRGWRSEQASWVTGEGSGIGLWIVDHIMKMHDGDLIITPTSAAKVTEIRLVFPTEISR